MTGELHEVAGSEKRAIGCVMPRVTALDTRDVRDDFVWRVQGWNHVGTEWIKPWE